MIFNQTVQKGKEISTVAVNINRALTQSTKITFLLIYLNINNNEQFLHLNH